MNYPDTELRIWKYKHTSMVKFVSRTPPKTTDGWELVDVVPYEPNATGGVRGC